MLALERQREISGLVAAQGSVRVVDLARRYAVTEETIRRDLEKLEVDGKLVRSHGGAVPPGEDEAPHWQREFVNQAEKEAIARDAAVLVVPGEVVVLDASSTAWFLARRLAAVDVTVITNSLYSSLAAGQQRARVLSPGGTLSAKSMSFIGSETQQALRRYHANKVFISCRGVDLQRGASDLSEEQALVRRAMLEIADEKILLVDSAKFGVRSLVEIAPLETFKHVITDSAAPEAYCREIEARGVSVTRAVPLEILRDRL